MDRMSTVTTPERGAGARDMGLPNFPIPTGVFSAVQARVYEDVVLELERVAIETMRS
jgi:hypothetical protein